MTDATPRVSARVSARVAAPLITVVLAVLVALPASPASAAPRFVKRLAGPSIAAMYPSGVEYDRVAGRIVVADTGLDRVVFYSMNGAKLGGFGRHGTGNRGFDSPRDVAIDGVGNIYVADAGNNRVTKFSPSGQWRWSRGGTGPCDSCLNTPIGVTWDHDNEVLLVASTGQNLLKAFTPAGAVAWVSPTAAQLGIGAPRDLARGPDGRIWVADYKNHRVKAFNVTSNGVWTTSPVISLGGNGRNLGQLNFPYNMAFSADGNTLYVADTGNNRIARWNLQTSPPTPLSQIGKKCDAAPDPCPDPPADWGTIDTLRRVVMGPGMSGQSATLITADFWGNGLQVWKTSGLGDGTTDAMLRQIELAAAPAPGFAQAFGVDVGDDGKIYAVDRLNQRLQYFSPKGVFRATGGSRGTQPDRFSWPEAVAVGPNGEVWAADTRGGRIQRWKVNVSGATRTVGRQSSPGDSGPGTFNYIEDLDVAPDGRVYIADTRNHRIQVYAPGTGTFSIFPAAAALSGPQGVAVSTKHVVVADTANDRILKFSRSTGALLSTFGPSGFLQAPEGVAIAGDNTIWVADTSNHRIVHLSAGLRNLKHTFGAKGGGRMRFDAPHTLAVRGARLLVADTFNHRVQIFNISSP